MKKDNQNKFCKMFKKRVESSFLTRKIFEILFSDSFKETSIQIQSK